MSCCRCAGGVHGGTQALDSPQVDPSKSARYRAIIAEGEASRREDQVMSSFVKTRSGARLADMHHMGLLLDSMRDADRRLIAVEDARRLTSLLRVRIPSEGRGLYNTLTSTVSFLVGNRSRRRPQTYLSPPCWKASPEGRCCRNTTVSTVVSVSPSTSSPLHRPPDRVRSKSFYRGTNSFHPRPSVCRAANNTEPAYNHHHVG